MISGKSCLPFQHLGDCKHKQHLRGFLDGLLERLLRSDLNEQNVQVEFAFGANFISF